MSNPGCEILFPAEKKFWGSPELVEKVLLLLDLASIKEMAEAHKLTRIILGGALVWDNQGDQEGASRGRGVYALGTQLYYLFGIHETKDEAPLPNSGRDRGFRQGFP